MRGEIEERGTIVASGFLGVIGGLVSGEAGKTQSALRFDGSESMFIGCEGIVMMR